MKIVTSKLLRNELFRRSEFSGNNVVIPHTSEGALAKLKRLEVVETRQEKSEGTSNLAVLEEGNHTSGDVTFTVTNGVVTANGTNNTSTIASVKAGTVYLHEGKTYYRRSIGSAGGTGAYIVHNGEKWFTTTEQSFVASSTGECDIILTTGVGQTPAPNLKLLISETSGDTWVQGKKQIPSLNYPSEIECVGDNINEFDKDSITENKYININNGTLGSSTTSHTSDYIKVYANETCILSYDYDELKATGKRGYCYFDESKKYISGTEYTATNREVVFTPNANGYIRFSYDMNAYNIKFERNAKKTAYSKFGQGSVEISTSNKNVLNLTAQINRTINGLECHSNGNKITLNGTSTAATDIHLHGYWGAETKDIKHYLLAGLYSFSTGNGKYDDRIRAIICQKSIIATAIGSNKGKITINQDTYYSNFYIRIEAGTTFNNETFCLQLEKGDEITDYVEHKGEEYILETQQKMFKDDAFEKIDGVWYEKHKKKERIFTEENNFTLQSINQNGIANFFAQRRLEKIDPDLFNTIECSHFVWSGSLISTTTEPNVHTQQSGEIYFRVPSSLASTVEEFKVYLKNNNIQVVYPLAEPELIPCTEEQIAVLSELESMTTYADTTIIKIDNDMTEITVEAEQSRMSMLEENMRKENEVICENS